MGEILRFPDHSSSASRGSSAGRGADDRTDGPDPLWRELVGRELHRERAGRGERLVDVAQRAGVSMQYLSEVERGLKDPSSEMLQAIAGALDLSVRELAGRVHQYDALCLAA